MIELPQKFKLSIGKGIRTSIFPLVRIYRGLRMGDEIPDNAESINISIKEVSIKNKDGVYEPYIPLLLNSPKTNSKIDLTKNTYKISSVNLDISNGLYNGKIFSDLIGGGGYLNAVCEIIYCTGSIDRLDDCVVMYTGTIRRYSQTKEKVSITLEDLTEEKLKTTIPSTVIEDTESYGEKLQGSVMPMVYGYVDKSPTITNKDYEIELDKKTKEIAGPWYAVSYYTYPNLSQDHLLYTASVLARESFLSVYDGGYIDIQKKVVRNFGSRENLLLMGTSIYQYSPPTVNSSANLTINTENALHESYVDDPDLGLVGQGPIGIPTRIYRPIVDVEFHGQRVDVGVNEYNDANTFYIPATNHRFFGYDVGGTNISTWQDVAKAVNVYAWNDESINNFHSNLQEHYDSSWADDSDSAHAKKWWEPTLINLNNQIDEHITDGVDLSWKTFYNTDGRFPVSYIQDGADNTGLHVDIQNRQGRQAGAFVRFKLNEVSANFPAVTKLHYRMDYFTPTNEMESETIGHPFRASLQYEPARFWVEPHLVKRTDSYYNTQYNDMDGSNNNWDTDYDTEDWITWGETPNETHFFESGGTYADHFVWKSPLDGQYNSPLYNATSEGYATFMKYNNILLNFNSTQAYDSINFGYPQCDEHSDGFFHYTVGSVMSNISDLYVYQDCLVTDILSKQLYASVIGRVNNQGNVLTKPYGILADILESELNYEKEIVYPNPEIPDDWLNSFTLNEAKQAKDIIDGLFQSSIYIPTFNASGDFSVKPIIQDFPDERYEDYYGQKISKIVQSELINYTFGLTKIEDVKNQVNVKYKYDYGEGISSKETGYGIESNSGVVQETLDDLTNVLNYNSEEEANRNKYDIGFYGVNSEDSKLDFESPYIRDTITAKKLQRKLLMWHCNQHLTMKLDLPISYMYLEIGDYVKFDSLIAGKLAFGNDYIKKTHKNGQVIFPVFIINKITNTLSKVTIEVTQIHRGEPGENLNQLGDYFIPNPYSGDIYGEYIYSEEQEEDWSEEQEEDLSEEQEEEEESETTDYVTTTVMDNNGDGNPDYNVGTGPVRIQFNTDIIGEFDVKIYMHQLIGGNLDLTTLEGSTETGADLDYGSQGGLPPFNDEFEYWQTDADGNYPPNNAFSEEQMYQNNNNFLYTYNEIHNVQIDYNEEGNGGIITLTPTLSWEGNNIAAQFYIDIASLDYNYAWTRQGFAQTGVAGFETFHHTGDIDRNGYLNVLDVVGTMQYVLQNIDADDIMSTYGISEEEFRNIADTNDDGIVNILDIIEIVQLILAGG